MTSYRTFKTLKHKATSLVIAAATLVSLAAPANSQERNRSQIEGSWLCTNTRINQGFSFTAVLSFGAGGVLLATGSVAGPALLQGGWAPAESHNFDSTIYFFAFDPDGNAVALIKTVQSFQMTSADELVGTGVSYACDMQSENCVEDPSVRIRITGRRVVSEKQKEF
jgi:hypothetical protein